MKKSILVSALLLAGAGCAAEQAGDLSDVESDAITARADLIHQVFVSKDSFKTTHYKWDETTKTSVPFEVTVKLRFKFIRAENYTLDGRPNRGLDYEVVVEEFIESTGESFPTDMTYYVRRKGKALHYFYDCDSTRRCENNNGGGRDKMYIYDLPGGGKGLKLVQKEVVIIDPSSALGIAPHSEIEFVAVSH